MEDSIGKLFELDFRESAFSFETNDRVGIQREWELYEKLLTQCTDEEKQVFLEYIRIRERREGEEIKNAYKKGFVSAIKLWTESLKK